MKTDSEIRYQGMQILLDHMDNLDAERFITLIHRDQIDYTEWRKNLFPGLSGREISNAAMAYETEHPTKTRESQ